MSKLLQLLTASLSVAPIDSTKSTALEKWEADYVPRLKADAVRAFEGGLEWENIGDLAEVTVEAANALRGVFVGTDRAIVAQTVLVEVVKDTLPTVVDPWVLPLIGSKSVEGLIEAAFQKVCPPTATTPVVDAADVPPLEIK